MARRERQRLDLTLVALGLAPSRSKAQALIRAGEVLVDGQVFDKPGMAVAADAAISVRARDPYVGRGAHKLAAALDRFELDPRDLACLDVGASTGGFTDVLLQRGARIVYAVDVGRGQLAWSLRNDPRVVSMERTDIRRVQALPETIDLATVDVSFISLRLVLPAIRRLLSDDAQVVILVKPQFEAGRDSVGRGGVVRDPAVHAQVLAEIISWASEHGWRVMDSAPSPITGSRGNREFLLLARPASTPGPGPDVEGVVRVAMGD
jgi:23S rRNA (cytidine1920-2'-O)/16S rRNA (cytidine1409-2'-O)-methyltransferase